MKKIFLSILAVCAMAVYVTSCDGYDDKQLGKVVPYGPTKSATLQVGGTVNLRTEIPQYKGAWTTSNDTIAVVSAEGIVTAMSDGVTYMNATDATNLYFKVVVVE